jgi:hypothetical protein
MPGRSDSELRKGSGTCPMCSHERLRQFVRRVGWTRAGLDAYLSLPQLQGVGSVEETVSTTLGEALSAALDGQLTGRWLARSGLPGTPVQGCRIGHGFQAPGYGVRTSSAIFAFPSRSSERPSVSNWWTSCSPQSLHRDPRCNFRSRSSFPALLAELRDRPRLW